MQLLSKISQLSGIQPQQRRTEHKYYEHKKGQETKAAKTKKQVRIFMGETGYLRRSIPGYAEMAHPLTHLTTDEVRFIWDEKDPFIKLVKFITSQPCIAYPDPAIL